MNQNYHTKVAKQIIDSIDCLDPHQYSEKLAVLNGVSLGQHFRHIIEFYQCLLEAKSSGIVNYDKRQRDLNIETDKNYALQVSTLILEKLETLHQDTQIGLESCFGDEIAIIPSTFARELVYLSEHTIHHFALIKIGISTSFPNISISKNFGVADSTIKYQKSQS